MVKTKTKHVYLDLTHLDKGFIKKRFPRIYATCLQFNIDITKDLIPVSPAAHYIMGGVKTNLVGETTIKGLFAAGEVACTGVHGANRLASNSLLEGLVYGARTGRAAAEFGVKSSELKVRVDSKTPNPELKTPNFDVEKIKNSLRQLMWEKVGIIRCRESLIAAREQLKKWDFMLKADFLSRQELEVKNMLTVADLIIDAALLREDSIGAHYRSDFKERGRNWQRHSVCQKDKGTTWIDSN